MCGNVHLAQRKKNNRCLKHLFWHKTESVSATDSVLASLKILHLLNSERSVFVSPHILVTGNQCCEKMLLSNLENLEMHWNTISTDTQNILVLICLSFQTKYRCHYRIRTFLVTVDWFFISYFKMLSTHCHLDLEIHMFQFVFTPLSACLCLCSYF